MASYKSSTTGMTPCCAIGFFSWFLLIGLIVFFGLLFSSTGPAKLSALFPLIFVAVGGGGVWWRIKNWGKSPEKMAVGNNLAPSSALPLPPIKTANGRTFPVRLNPAMTRGIEAAGIGCFALFWNALVSVFVFHTASEWAEGHAPWFLTLFLVPFVLVGCGVLFAFVRALVRNATVPETEVEISAEPLCPGETARVRIAQAGRLSMANITVDLVCEERISYTRGTDTYREQNVVFQRRLVDVSDVEVTPPRGWEATVEIAIPPDAMHSFHAAHNDLVYEIRVNGVVKRLPDFKTVFPFRVLPPHTRGLLR